MMTTMMTMVAMGMSLAMTMMILLVVVMVMMIAWAVPEELAMMSKESTRVFSGAVANEIVPTDGVCGRGMIHSGIGCALRQECRTNSPSACPIGMPH